VAHIAEVLERYGLWKGLVTLWFVWVVGPGIWIFIQTVDGDGTVHDFLEHLFCFGKAFFGLKLL
jgi:hypothetical protein